MAMEAQAVQVAKAVMDLALVQVQLLLEHQAADHLLVEALVQALVQARVQLLLPLPAQRQALPVATEVLAAQVAKAVTAAMVEMAATLTAAMAEGQSAATAVLLQVQATAATVDPVDQLAVLKTPVAAATATT